MEMERNLPKGNTVRNRPREKSAKKLIERLFKAIKTHREFNRSLWELRGMSDQQLSDIGLSRTDVERVDAKSLFRDPTMRDRW